MIAYDNTASGTNSLYSNTTGTDNTALGWAAMYANTIGQNNTGVGSLALNANTGSHNTGIGFGALYSNTYGGYNTALGDGALGGNFSGSYNTAIGYAAYNAVGGAGNWNTAIGFAALQSNTTGGSNIALGVQAGFYLTTGSNNIDIGNVGLTGESNTIRIGTKGTHRATVIAGIYGSPITGAPVVVSSTGRLGVTVSSERYKTGIAPMGVNSDNLQRLRPVTFHLKSDPRGALQYGLIAEEVAKVYPELVIRGESGRIDGVRYDELAPMLLNEVQRQQQEIAEMHAAIVKLQRQ